MLHLPMCAALPPPKGASPLAALVMRSKHSLVRNPDWVGSAVDQGRRCISAAGRHRFKQHLPAGEDELKPAAGNLTPPLPRQPSPLPPPHTYLAEGHQVHVQAGLQAMVLLHHVALRKERRQ